MSPTSKLILALFVGHISAHISIPMGFELRNLASGLNPTAMTVAPDGRIFFCEKHGVLRLFRNDTLVSEPVLVLHSIDSYNERGLVGVAIDPDFDETNHIYVQYTHLTNTLRKARTSRYTLIGDVADPNSELVLIDLDIYTSGSGIHNGGSLIINADRKLFIFVGDIGDRSLSQRMTSTYGKILRINLDGSIPEDNPFYQQNTGVHRAIWANGLRNPFMVAYDRKNDSIVVGDVGENTWEEINMNQRGANYGWPFAEGFDRAEHTTAPIIAYRHNTGCAITGLSFYYNTSAGDLAFPDQYNGKLLFADYCFGWIRMIDIYADLGERSLSPTNIHIIAPVVVTGIGGAMTMAQSSGNGMYFVDRGTHNGAYSVNTGVSTGTLFKLIYTGSPNPSIHTQPRSVTLPIGFTGGFRVGVTGPGQLRYQWFVDGHPLFNEITDTLIIQAASSQYNQSTFFVEISNSYATARSNNVTLTILQSAVPPTISQTATKYKAGDVITFTANDPYKESVVTYAWTVELNHQTHTHPVASYANYRSISLTVPLDGEKDPVQWYTVYLTVANSIISLSTTAVVTPCVSAVTLSTSPNGLAILIDQVETVLTEPKTDASVVGMSKLLTALLVRRVDDVIYAFVGWSDGIEDIERSVTFAESNQTLTAVYKEVLALQSNSHRVRASLVATMGMISLLML